MGKILILGGTGAIGTYLVEELQQTSHDVYVTSRQKHADVGNINYIQGNAKDDDFVFRLLEENFDCVIDFMSYKTPDFFTRYQKFLQHARQYIFLSSYRVYADNGLAPITEKSPRLLDVSEDKKYLQSDEYALAKARQENLLQNSGYKNYTIIRPSVTFSKRRFQLGTLEADSLIPRARQKRPVVLPEDILNKYAAFSWAGDVAKMIGSLVLNTATYGEVYNVCSSEKHTWREIAGYYDKYIGLKVKEVDLDIYLDTVARGGVYQVLYDRMFNRIMDNSKILKQMNCKNLKLCPIEQALKTELSENNLEAIEPNRKVLKKINKALRRKAFRGILKLIKFWDRS